MHLDDHSGEPGRRGVAVLLVVLGAVTGGAAIMLLTIAHQLCLGLACAAVAVGALALADPRLRPRDRRCPTGEDSR
ncbi:hypothetical protein [Amycolatopsis magusensis]|uniref:hypothetical protein n=1 Tax=Amycolatopsis magusensis TaxID=882444 RepID=UPI0037AFA07D